MYALHLALECQNIMGMEILLKYKANPAMENLIGELLLDVILANLVLKLNMVLFKLVDILLVH
jgi:hypothetical protein